MTTTIMRSFLVHWGQSPPPDLHSIVTDHLGERRVVTWSMQRRAMQADRLRQKLYVRQTRAWRVCVAYFDQRLMGGWQAFIDRVGERIWIDRDRQWLKEPLMKLFSLTLLDWEAWKAEFARAFQRGKQDHRPRGAAVVWLDGHDPRSLRRAHLNGASNEC